MDYGYRDFLGPGTGVDPWMVKNIPPPTRKARRRIRRKATQRTTNYFNSRPTLPGIQAALPAGSPSEAQQRKEYQRYVEHEMYARRIARRLEGRVLKDVAQEEREMKRVKRRKKR